MSEVNKSASQMWNRMYPQPPQADQMLRPHLNKLQLNVNAAKEIALTLPHRYSEKMGRHLQTLIHLLAQIDSAAIEKQAAGGLVKKFGPPEFEGAVSTFNLLIGYLHNAENATHVVSQKTTKAVQEIEVFLYKISIIMHEEEIRALEKKVQTEEQAGRKFSAGAQGDERPWIRASIVRARKGFEITAKNLRAEIKELRLQQNKWMMLISQMSRSSATAQKTANMRYEMNPSMAAA